MILHSAKNLALGIRGFSGSEGRLVIRLNVFLLALRSKDVVLQKNMINVIGSMIT